jgi:hypothetical protein
VPEVTAGASHILSAAITPNAPKLMHRGTEAVPRGSNGRAFPLEKRKLWNRAELCAKPRILFISA